MLVWWRCRASARRFLLKIAKVAVEHTKLKAKAAFELKRIIDDIRIEMYRWVAGWTGHAASSVIFRG